LSEFANTLDNPDQPDEPNPRLEAYAKSYADHLLHVHRGRHVRLFLVRHQLAGVEEVKEGMRLDDPSLYVEKPRGEFGGGGE
jgi:hypothetical protein